MAVRRFRLYRLHPFPSGAVRRVYILIVRADFCRLTFCRCDIIQPPCFSPLSEHSRFSGKYPVSFICAIPESDPDKIVIDCRTFYNRWYLQNMLPDVIIQLLYPETFTEQGTHQPRNGESHDKTDCHRCRRDTGKKTERCRSIPNIRLSLRNLSRKESFLPSAPADSSSASGSCLRRSKISCSTSRTAARSCAPRRRF